MIVSVVNQKGGVGKTTLAINLAACFSCAGRRVLLVDADPQGSALAWSGVREAEPLFTVVGMAKPTLHRELPALAEQHDAVVIDGPPRVNEIGRAAILASDLVLIPVQPSPPDIWAAEGTLKLAAAEKRKAAIVLNRVPSSGKLRETMAAQLQQDGKPLLTATIGNRTAFASAFAEGLAVTETAPRSIAANELRALLTELLELIG